MAELPAVQVLHEKYEKNPKVAILAMNVMDPNDKMAKYWREKNYTFPTLNDADSLADEYGVRAFPSAYLIGPDGKVVRAAMGPAHLLAKHLEKALAGEQK